MNYVFISDLHLEPTRPQVAELFIDFLKQQPPRHTTLYILGDLFEVWIGDDDKTSFNQYIISSLQSAVLSGMKISIIHGNRDFLLGKQFIKETGCKLLPDYQVIDIHNTKVLLTHGDLLCTLDRSYLKFRKMTRKWWLQKLFLLTSLKRRQAIANHMRLKSNQYNSTKAEHIMDVTLHEVENVMRKFEVLHLIHGHTHREAVHQFQIANQPATRTVLGAWHERGSALVWNDKGRELIKI